jgi:hypothetical protein
MARYTVIKSWDVTYPDPIVLIAGQLVSVDTARREENPAWAGWIWCRTADHEGWVPEQILEISGTSACARAGYSARELAVRPGDAVEGDLITNGWLWCRKEAGSEYGWVPLENLSKAT